SPNPSSPSMQHSRNKGEISSKSKRVQRRKDIQATTEALGNLELDSALSVSPPQATTVLTTDSDDSEPITQPVMIKGKKRELKRKTVKLSSSLPSASSFPPLNTASTTKPPSPSESSRDSKEPKRYCIS